MTDKDMNYIVFDLEWNQSAEGKECSVEHMPFEIIVDWSCEAEWTDETDK